MLNKKYQPCMCVCRNRHSLTADGGRHACLLLRLSRELAPVILVAVLFLLLVNPVLVARNTAKLLPVVAQDVAAAVLPFALAFA